jgi:hypothetical protein
MNKKLPFYTRGIFITAFLLLLSTLLNTTPVQSAFPNAPTAGTLDVIVSVTKDYGGTAVAGDFTINVTGTNVIPSSFPGEEFPGTTITMDPGTYSVSEVPLTGYIGSNSTDCTGTIAEGETKTCTITINDIAPNLTVIKNVVNDYGGILTEGNFTINVTGTEVSLPSFPGAVSPGTTVTLDAGAYSVAETPVTGYEATYSADCSGTILVGETKTCTITNEDFARLTVVKDPTNDSGGNALPDDFLLTVNGSSVLSGVATEYPIDTLLAINETQLVGYTFVGITDDGSGKCPAVLGGTITLALGDDITCTIVNDDIPTISPVPAEGLVTDENGTTDQFTVVLTTIPSNKVTIAISSSVPTEALATPAQLDFSVDNWDTPQPVTVTGVDDPVADGDIPFNIILNPATSPAAEYASLTPVQVSGINFDNDTAGYIITPTENLYTTEGGVVQNVQISLRSRPTALVTLNLVNSDPTEGTLSTSTLNVDPSTWPQPAKEFTVTGVDDTIADGNIPYSITITANSVDLKYSGPVSVLPIINHDAPTIRWIKPARDGEIYYSDSLSIIDLLVESVGNEPINKVRFYRWVPGAGDWVTIGEDLFEPYNETLHPEELEFEWNEIRAFAFGPVPTLPGDIQTFSPHPLTYIFRYHLVFPPLVFR